MEKITRQLLTRIAPEGLSKAELTEHRKGLEQPARMAESTFVALHELLNPVVGTMAGVMGALKDLRKPLTDEETTEIKRLIKGAPYLVIKGKGVVDKKDLPPREKRVQRPPFSKARESVHGRKDTGVTRKAKPDRSEEFSEAELDLIRGRLAESEAHQTHPNPDIKTYGTVDLLAAELAICGRGVSPKLCAQYEHDLRHPEQMSKATHLALDKAHLHLIAQPEEKRSERTLQAIAYFLGKSPWSMVKGAGLISRAELESQTASYEEGACEIEQVLEQQDAAAEAVVA